MTTATAIIFALFASGPGATLVYDSGEPVARDGDVPFMSVWRVLDPLDNLCVRVVAPIELTAQTRVTALAFYCFDPKDPADKLIDIYQGTDESGVGTLLHALSFNAHQGVRQGWNVFTLGQPINLPAGKYGISFHGRYEFHAYWAGNAPNGPGFAWARINDDRDWFCGYEDDYGVVPNFALRVYGFQRVLPLDDGARQEPPARHAPVGAVRKAGQQQGLSEAPVDTSVPGTPDDHEYEPGTAEDDFHIVWRPVRTEHAGAEEPK